MEITGLECSHKDCDARVFLDDPEAPDWLTVVMTSPGSGFRRKVHYCLDHGRGLVDNTDLDDEKLTTGQQKIINPAHVDERLARELDTANDEDLARAGLIVPREPEQWEPAATAAMPVPVDVGELELTEELRVEQLPTHPHTATQPIRVTRGTRQVGKAKGGRRGASAAAVRSAMTVALLFCAGLLGK